MKACIKSDLTYGNPFPQYEKLFEFNGGQLQKEKTQTSKNSTTVVFSRGDMSRMIRYRKANKTYYISEWKEKKGETWWRLYWDHSRYNYERHFPEAITSSVIIFPKKSFDLSWILKKSKKIRIGSTFLRKEILVQLSEVFKDMLDSSEEVDGIDEPYLEEMCISLITRKLVLTSENIMPLIVCFDKHLLSSRRDQIVGYFSSFLTRETALEYMNYIPALQHLPRFDLDILCPWAKEISKYLWSSEEKMRIMGCLKQLHVSIPKEIMQFVIREIDDPFDFLEPLEELPMEILTHPKFFTRYPDPEKLSEVYSKRIN